MHPQPPESQDVSRRDLLLMGVAAGTYGMMAVPKSRAASPDAEWNPFIVQPYLQLGNAPAPSEMESLQVLWHADPGDSQWVVELDTSLQGRWNPAGPVTGCDVAVESIPAYRVYKATLRGLEPGSEFQYRLKRDDQTVFQAAGRARKAAGVPHRFALFGDCGSNSPGQKSVAYQVSLNQPDYVLHPGDAVYEFARMSEYRNKYFPIYNAEKPDAKEGAPLLRSIPFFTGPGAHDEQATLDDYDDVLSYYIFWSLPLNGPNLKSASPLTFSPGGTEAARQATFTAAEDRFPRMAHYSFRYGDVHWTVLDTWGSHLDWNSPVLRGWLEETLANGQDATWRFVSCYLPPFNSSTAWPQGQKMRLLSEIFERYGVDIVFSGYAHSYQRTYPLRFRPSPRVDGPVSDPEQLVPGEFQFDESFDGRQHTTPDGVLYLVSGGGGNPGLHSPEQTDNPRTWQPFTVRYVADVNHFTLVDVNGPSLSIRQIDETGRELDAFTVTKPGS